MKKLGYSAKCFNSSEKRINLVRDKEETSRSILNCGFIDIKVDSKPEHEVFQLKDRLHIKRLVLLACTSGKPRSLSIQFESGSSVFYSTIDTGCPVWFLNSCTVD